MDSIDGNVKVNLIGWTKQKIKKNKNNRGKIEAGEIVVTGMTVEIEIEIETEIEEEVMDIMEIIIITMEAMVILIQGAVAVINKDI